MATFVRDPKPVELRELREYRERHDLALIELGPTGLAEQLTWP